ncbi:NADAR family protein [Thiofilum flexile]|uniref:NADAR family protein n=1 Tax=Thiofilum flexile TaxID=125627 RepID=UPI0003686BAF|nr:NADAR family protein [Thiofilum flexile]
MINSRAALMEYLALGNSVKYLHFWGHTPKGKGVDASCLSQWFPASFVLDNVVYLTAEHYMMAQKARLFGNEDMLAAILTCKHPGEAKKLGRKVRNFNADTWNQHCFAYVVEGNVAKFGQNPALKAFLLGTGERVLVEASPHDSIWGIGMEVSHPDAANPSKWLGSNLLGFALMVARERLARESLGE